jgi:uncharacterized protein YegP (UPF0339 family)
MGTAESNPLVEVYSDRIGQPSTADEAFGYWVYVIGVIAGLLGIVLVLLSDSPGQTVRGVGIALAALGLLLLMIGPTIRLPLRRPATLLSYAGAAVGVIGVAWFLNDFSAGNWGAAFENNEVLIMATYSVGILAISAGSMFVPLLTSPREEQAAAEARAGEAERERDAAVEEAGRQATEATEQRAQREQLERELQRIEDSQSQFELYTDSGGKHRWRLRHRNRNIVADSAQGYSSRQKAQQGLSAVKRDAVGAGVVDLDRVEDAEMTPTDEETVPEFVEDTDSNATFETYEDARGKHRWRLVHDNGNIIADSTQGYASRQGRDDAVERARGYVQSADYLKLDPAAFERYRDNAGQYRWRLLHKNGNIMADSGQGYSSRRAARNGVESVRKNVAEGGNAEFDVYEDNAGDYRWRLVHTNGNIIADCGQGYASKSGAEDAVSRVRSHAPEGHVLDIGSAAFEIYEDEAEEWRWRLRHRNGNIMADGSEGYASRGGAEDGIHSVKHNAPNAPVEPVEE